MAATRKIVFPRFDRSSFLVLVVALGLTAIAWYAVRTSVDLYDSARFNALAKDIHDDVSFQMQTYVNTLLQTKGLFNASEEVTRAEFEEYIRTVHLLERYPGIQGVGFTLRIPARELARHLRQVRQTGFPEYRVWPQTPRDEYFSILYLEPFDWRNQRAFGYDMYTEPVRRQAMAVARDTGEPAATEKVVLVQETDTGQQPGFLIYVPLYRNGLSLGTVEERRHALVGFVYSPFRARDLFEGIFGAENAARPVDFEVYDGATVAAQQLLHDNDGKLYADNAEFVPRFKQEIKLDIAGRPWTILVYSLPAFDLQWSKYLPAAVLLVGLVVTLLLGLTMRAVRNELDSSRRSKLLLESMSDAVNVSDESGIITYTNAAQEKMFGYGPGELVGKHVSVHNAYAPEENARVVAAIIRELTTKGEWSGELQNKRKDGTLFITAARISALELAGKKYFVAVQQDVTERKRAEQALRESEARFRQMADQAPIMIWMSGPDKGCNYVNKPWLDFTGRSAEEELGDGWTQGLHADDREAFLHTYASSFDARREFSIEYRLRRRDGEYRWVLNKGVARVTADGRFVGYIGSCVDITDRKQFEEALQEAIKARDAFLSVVSHELRTPLTSLKLQAQIRKKKLEAGQAAAFTEANLAKMIETDNRQIERLHRLVDEMLDISRISAGRLTMHREAVDLCRLAREVVERLDAQFEAARCQVRLHCPAELCGTWDYFRLEQVLINLLTNAMKYGAGKPIEITLRRQDDRAVLQVRDHGMGIAPEDQQRIFERYERVESATHIGGLGLGLYIVCRILDAHGGSIRVDSTPGSGATFTAEIPLAAGAATAPADLQTTRS